MIEKIQTYPSKWLSLKTKEIDEDSIVTSDIIELTEAVKSLVDKSPNALAIAANQVGLSHKFFVLNHVVSEEISVPQVIINPIIQEVGKDLVSSSEGCLSFPGFFFNISRPNEIVCSFSNLIGERKSVKLEGIHARIFLHECEHLDGKVFIDNLDRIKRFQVIGQMRKRR